MDEWWVGDDWCDDELNCEEAGWDGGDCDSDCPDGEVLACWGGCYPESWLADDECDDPFDCEEFAWDEGDCQ